MARLKKTWTLIKLSSSGSGSGSKSKSKVKSQKSKLDPEVGSVMGWPTTTHPPTTTHHQATFFELKTSN